MLFMLLLRKVNLYLIFHNFLKRKQPFFPSLKIFIHFVFILDCLFPVVFAYHLQALIYFALNIFPNNFAIAN